MGRGSYWRRASTWFVLVGLAGVIAITAGWPYVHQHWQFPGATAICRDQTFSYSQTRSGTCSFHQGVGRWLR